METSETIFRLEGLRKLDIISLKNQPGISITETPIPEGAHGDIMTYIVEFTPPAMAILAAFLMKPRDETIFTNEITKISPDGTVEVRKLHYDHKSSKSPDLEVIKQILS